MANPPALTPEQRAAALQKAAEARAARAELKEKLKMGSVTLSDALAKADSNDSSCVSGYARGSGHTDGQNRMY